MTEIYASSVNYWKSGTSTPDSWLDKTQKEIESVGGVVHTCIVGMAAGKSAVMMGFVLEGQEFRVTYPVLAVTREKDKTAALRQACTALYHDVKARCVSLKFIGAKSAFFTFLLLPDGRTAGQLATPELMAEIPGVFLLPPPREEVES